MKSLRITITALLCASIISPLAGQELQPIAEAGLPSRDVFLGIETYRLWAERAPLASSDNMGNKVAGHDQAS
jgi:hypothetical protein